MSLENPANSRSTSHYPRARNAFDQSTAPNGRMRVDDQESLASLTVRFFWLYLLFSFVKKNEMSSERFLAIFDAGFSN